MKKKGERYYQDWVYRLRPPPFPVVVSQAIIPAGIPDPLGPGPLSCTFAPSGPPKERKDKRSKVKSSGSRHMSSSQVSPTHSRSGRERKDSRSKVKSSAKRTPKSPPLFSLAQPEPGREERKSKVKEKQPRRGALSSSL